MSYSVINIGCTLFSIIRSSSGAHGCHNSNSGPDRIEMIIMDGKSQKIWAAELSILRRKANPMPAIGYCNQTYTHQNREHTNQPQGAYACDIHPPGRNLHCKPQFSSGQLYQCLHSCNEIASDSARKPSPPAPVVLVISVPDFSPSSQKSRKRHRYK